MTQNEYYDKIYELNKRQLENAEWNNMLSQASDMAKNDFGTNLGTLLGVGLGGWAGYRTGEMVRRGDEKKYEEAGIKAKEMANTLGQDMSVSKLLGERFGIGRDWRTGTMFDPSLPDRVTGQMINKYEPIGSRARMVNNLNTYNSAQNYNSNPLRYNMTLPQMPKPNPNNYSVLNGVRLSWNANTSSYTPSYNIDWQNPNSGR